MSDVGILDASAVLAYLREEEGRKEVASALASGGCRISAVNVCEVLGKLCENGMPEDEALATLNDLRVTIVPFDRELAAFAAFLRVRTRPIGASLGDRACLALALKSVSDSDTPAVYTAERTWARLKWPFKIVTIR